MKSISSRKFILCHSSNKEVPRESDGCCEFYNAVTGKCEFQSVKISKRHITKLSERSENYDMFNQSQSEE